MLELMSHINHDSVAKTVEILSEQSTCKGLCHEHRDNEPFPSEASLHRIIELVRAVIFPGIFGNYHIKRRTIKHYLSIEVKELHTILFDQILAGLCFSRTKQNFDKTDELLDLSLKICNEVIEYLPELKRLMNNDVDSAYKSDPAATSYAEVIFCYPSIRTILSYRLAHKLALLHVPIIPRMLTEMAHSETGIDIHPEAAIGENFFIDHGTGVVIGATSIIGNNVSIYQGVTLGAKKFDLDETGHPIKGIPRHPIIEDNVTIYSNSTILGRITIGEDTIIGANMWITESVEKGSKIVKSKYDKIKLLTESESRYQQSKLK